MAYNREPHSRTLPVPVTPEEQNKAGRDAADLYVAIAKLEKEIKDHTAPRKEQINELKGPALVQAKIAESGFKDDKVECMEQWLDNYQIQVIRMDTGDVVEGPRMMTKEEIQKFNQQPLPFAGTVEVDVPVEVSDPTTGEVTTTTRRKRVNLSNGSKDKN